MFNVIIGILILLLLIFDYYVLLVDGLQSEVLAKIAASLTFFVFFLLSMALAINYIF